jgi:hypothetical protein
MKIAIAALFAGALFSQSAPQLSYLVTAIPQGDGPVTDLTAADVTVREGGDARKVLSVQRAAFPLVVSVLVDGTQPPLGMSQAVRHVREGLAGFVTALRATSPGVRMSLAEVSGGVTPLASFDGLQTELDIAISKLFPAHPGDAVFLEAMGDAAKALTPMGTPRRAIVLIDFNSSESLSESTMKRTTDALTASGATVWSVSLAPPRASRSRREGALNLITKVSGGNRLVASESSGLPALLKQVADSLASQYTIAFERPAAAPPKDVTMATSRGVKLHVSLMRR